MTTDKFNKIISQKITVSGKKVTVNAICKGAGMIEPNMATMLSFVSIDLNISRKNLNQILKKIVNKTFNRISVDGDMSTNDSVALIATGGNPNIKTDSFINMKEIECKLEKIFNHLSEMIVMDGEGATKLITINILKSKTESIAKKISYAIANSNLFKTAMHGSDPNWGRIIAKLGSIEGINFTPSKVKLFINDILLFDNETNAKRVNHKKLKTSMKNKKIKIDLFLNNGRQSYTIKTSDLSKQYIHLNSAYPT
jgi:N-acetylglutamate synthase (N-acetylornithine aminotransferase)